MARDLPKWVIEQRTRPADDQAMVKVSRRDQAVQYGIESLQSRPRSLGVGALVLLAAAAALVWKSPNPGLQEALDACGPVVGTYVSDRGQSLTLDGRGAEDRYGLKHSVVECVLSQLDVPDHVLSQMERTRALDGTETAQWPGFSATWTYHPDAGLEVILVRD